MIARLSFTLLLGISFIWSVTAKTLRLRQANTQLQYSRGGFQQDYRDEWREPRRQRLWNGVERQRAGAPSIYNEAPRSTDEGWWNEEKRDFSTLENRRDLRKYSNSGYNSGYVPISNTKYDVTPDEWKERRYDSSGPYYGRQRGNYYNNQYDRQGYRDSYNRNDRYYQDGPSNGYSYGFGGNRGQVLGTYDPSQPRNYNYDQGNQFGNRRDSVQPQEWQDAKRQNYVQQDYYRDGYDQRRNYNDNRMYSNEPREGNWWNRENRDFSTRNGWRESRSFSGSGTSMDQGYSVQPEEWQNNGPMYGGRGGQQFVNFNGRSPYAPTYNWWNKMKDGIRSRSGNRRQNQYDNNSYGDEPRNYNY